jgi:hypothetical protein
MFLYKIGVSETWPAKKFNAVYGEVYINNNGAELISTSSRNTPEVAVLSHSGSPGI